MGRLDLFCTKIGQTMRYKFYEEIKSTPYGDSLLIVPNSIMLKEAQKNDISLVHVFDAFLKTILSEDTAEYKELSDIAKIKLIEKAILDVRRSFINLQVFVVRKNGKTVVKPGLSEALLAFRREIKNYRVTLESIIDNLQDKATLIKDIEAVYKRYDELCFQDESTIYVDIETKYEHAISLLTQGIKPKLKKIYFTDFYKLTPLQLKLIETIKRTTDIELVVSMEYEKDKSDGLFRTVKPTYEILSNIAESVSEIDMKQYAAEDLEYLASSFTGDYATEKFVGSKNISLKSFVNRDAEIRSAIAEIKEAVRNKSAVISDFAITARNLSDYSAIRRIADEYGVPVTMPRVGNLTSQGLVEFFDLLFKAAMDNAEAAKAYFRLLNCSIVRLLFKSVEKWVLTMPSEYYFTKRSNAQKVCRDKSGKATDNNDSSTRDILDAYIEQIENLEDKTINGYTELVLELLKGLEIEKKLGWRSAINREKFSVKELQEILLTKKALMGQLKALKEDGLLADMNDVITSKEYTNVLNTSMQDVDVVFERGRNDGLTIAKVVDIQSLKFKYLYVLGVREGEFPSKVRESWILGNAERKVLRENNIYLPLKEDYYTEDCYFFANAVATTEDKLCLSWFRDEGASDLDGGESLYIGYIKSMFAGLKELAGVYNYISSEYEDNIEKYTSEKFLKENLPKEHYYLSGLTIDRSEDEICDDVWEKITSRPLSASALKDYLECPLALLAKRIWGTTESRTLDDTPSAAHKGTFVHDVLEHFIKDVMIKEYKDKSFAYLSEADKSVLRVKLMDIFDATAVKMETEGMFGGPLWDLDKENLREKVQDWFEFECFAEEKLCTFAPSDTEWSFGFDGEEKFAVGFNPKDDESDEYVEVRFCGKVDRIDANNEGYYVIDYKTGTAPNKDDVQIPLYILAISENYKKDESKVPIGGSYLELKNAPVHKAEIFYYNLKTVAQNLEEERNKIIEPLKRMYNGNFGLAEYKKACTYCPLKVFCSKQK